MGVAARSLLSSRTGVPKPTANDMVSFRLAHSIASSGLARRVYQRATIIPIANRPSTAATPATHIIISHGNARCGKLFFAESLALVDSLTLGDAGFVAAAST